MVTKALDRRVTHYFQSCFWQQPHLGVAALLVANEHEGGAVNAANAANNSRVIQTSPITVQLNKLVGDVKDNIQASGPVGVAGHLKPLDRGQPAVGLLPQLQE